MIKLILIAAVLALSNKSFAETGHYGIYNVLISPTQAKARVYISDSQSIFGSVAYLSGIPKIEGSNVAHLGFWRAEWFPNERTFIAEGFSRRNVNSATIVFTSENSISGYFVTTDPAFSRPGPLQQQFTIRGERVPEEQELESLALSPQVTLGDDAEGTYVGKKPDAGKSRIELQLRSYDREGVRRWMSSLHLGDYTVPMTGYEDVDGLLRLVRTPTANASELSGLTLTVLRGDDGKITLRGIFFVPRNNRIQVITLTKVRGIGSGASSPNTKTSGQALGPL